MTKKERVFNAFKNKLTDRVPFGFWYHFSPDEDLGEQTVNDHLKLHFDTDMDFIKIMCDGYFNYPNPALKSATHASDLYDLKPLGKDHSFIRNQVARAKSIVNKLNGECPTFYNVFCPMSLFRFGTSEEKLMSLLKEDEKAVCHAFDIIAEDIKSLVFALITEAHTDGIYFCVQNAEQFRFTYDEYRRIVTPAELDVLKYANLLSENNILHCCGWAGDKNRIEVWQDYPAACINWAVYVEDMDLKKGKEFFGGKCVLGGFDNRKTGLLYTGTKEEIEAETARILKDAGRTGVIIGADCTLPSDIDTQRIKWVGDKLKELN